MTRGRQVTAVLAAFLITAAVPASAQSLADIARKEAERRRSAPATSKVYTNETLTPDFTKVPEPAPPATALPPDASGAAAEGTSTGGDAAAAPSHVVQAGVTPPDQQEPQPTLDKGEEYWRSMADRIRARLNQQNAEIADLQRRVSSFPAGAASPEHDIAVRALRKAQADLVDLNQEWLRFERQARDRNIPDAWIR
ncbi:MAG: hypothetical protein IT177_02500 [Acidobacteria bacterium]|nr:hypothetical protein [Acidobacteriota bacterium]